MKRLNQGKKRKIQREWFGKKKKSYKGFLTLINHIFDAS
jgi:hypothetical protein